MISDLKLALEIGSQGGVWDPISKLTAEIH